MTESLSGEFGGVGALMSQDRETGVITVLQVYEDSPAQKAGMQDGDVLYKVDGEDVSGRELTEVVNLVKGEKGTDVTLTLLRGDAGDEIELTVTRDTIEDQTVTYEMKEAGVGYIRVAEFDTVTYEQYKEALEDLEAQGMEKLVIDLRSNPGGNLETVCDMLDLMLPEGLIVYTEIKTAGGRSTPPMRSISLTSRWRFLWTGTAPALLRSLRAPYRITAWDRSWGPGPTERAWCRASLT